MNMGWDFTHATHYKNGKVDKKAMIAENLSKDFEMVKACEVGSVVYAAIKDIETGDVSAIVVLTRVKSSDYFNFGEKWMDEDCGPYYYDCPASILDLLTPTDNEEANAWRQTCRENIEKKKAKKKDPDALSNLPVGTVIEAIFGDQVATLVKFPANGRQFKRDFWKIKGEYAYCPASRIKEYVIIERGVA